MKGIIKKLRFEAEMLLIRVQRWAEGLKGWWFLGIVAFVMTAILIKTCRDNQYTKPQKEAVKELKQQNRVLNETEKQIVIELRKLKEHEVLILQENKAAKVRINRIPVDSLQHWADSLYGCPEGDTGLW